ncbi:MAG: glycosyltransferase family 39 protein [Flexilinea sp.]|nr:glycosyltransferase family 39 protein [Flexilinea sp.]
MRKKKLSEINFTHILVLYLVSFLIHCVLNIAVNEGPTVIIDEGLYTNLARSLAWEGKIAFRSQPIDYPYILYPLLLVPVYKLNRLLGGDIYRFIQVFNTILVTSSVIPAWFFALDFTKNKQKAFYTALLVSFMPDMIMGGYTMTESLIWPIALWLMYFSYRWYTQGKTSFGLLTALFTGLMYFAKPGAVAFGAVLMIIQLILSIKNKTKQIRSAVLSIGLLLVLIAAIYALYIFGFGQQKTFLGLYNKQTSEWTSKDILVAIEGTFLMTLVFTFACGGFFVLFPIFFLKKYESEDRNYILASLLGMLAVIIGTAVFVVPYKLFGGLGKLPLHMRYCSMFIPAFFVFTIGLELPARELKDRKAINIALIIFAVLCIFPGVRSGFVAGKTGTIDSIALSSFHTTNRLNGTATGWISTLSVICFIAYIYFELKNGWEKSLLKNSILFFMGFMLFNALCAHINAAVPIDPTIRKDALEVNSNIKDHTSLGITQRYYDDIYSYWLDCHLNEPMQQITIEQMFVEMDKSGGVYTPFVPIEQAPNINNHSTPDTETFVLGMTVGDQLKLSDNVNAHQTANGHFTVVEITPGERWVDSMIYGLTDITLYQDKTAFLHIFNEPQNTDEEMTLSIAASGNSSLVVNGVSFELDPEKTIYELTLPYSRVITITPENGDAKIYSYTLEFGKNTDS